MMLLVSLIVICKRLGSFASCMFVLGLSPKARVHGLSAQRSLRLEKLLKEEKQLHTKQEKVEVVGDDGHQEFPMAKLETPSLMGSQFR